MPPRFISRQLSRPTGLFARVMGRLMNRHNAEMNAFAARQLMLQPSDRALEIGFGGGAALPALIDGARFVCGVDRSHEMVDWARSTFAVAVKAGRADFREGVVESMPLQDGSFEKALTVNTVYFWRSLEAGFAEIYRVLAPGGRIVVGFLPKEWMDRLGHPPDIFSSRTSDQIATALAHCGFRDVRIERPLPTTKWCAAVATR